VTRKAAVGERVLIVNAGITVGKYENGDVHLITGKFLDYPTFSVVGGSIYANHTEYVVLEPVKSAEPSQDTIVQDGVTYRPTVAGEKPTHFIRKPDAGVRMTVIPGKVYEITRFDRDGDYRCVDEKGDDNVSMLVNSIGLVVDQPKPVRIPVGSYVKATQGLSLFRNVGDILKVTNDDGSGIPYELAQLNGSYAGYVDGSDIVVLSEAEVKAEAERKKWAAIGRKVNEYKAGDVVEIVRDVGGDPVGTITEIIGSVGNVRNVARKVTIPHVSSWSQNVTTIKLITPVEQRFDRTEAAGVAS
jgi:ribosomal protein L21E